MQAVGGDQVELAGGESGEQGFLAVMDRET